MGIDENKIHSSVELAWPDATVMLNKSAIERTPGDVSMCRRAEIICYLFITRQGHWMEKEVLV